MAKWFKTDGRYVRRNDNGKGVDDAWTQVTIPAANITAQSGSIPGRTGIMRYKKIGTTVHLYYAVTISNAGTGGGGLVVSGLPYPCVNNITVGPARQVNAGFAFCYALMSGSSFTIAKFDGTTPIVTGTTIHGTMTYETTP